MELLVKTNKYHIFAINKTLKMKNILSILLLCMMLTSCKNNDSKSSDFKIISFLKSEELVIVAGPVFKCDYAVLQISSDSIKGLLSSSAQGSVEYFISGFKMDEEYVGDISYLENDSVIGKFKLRIQDGKLKFIGDCSFDSERLGIPIFHGQHGFHGGAITGVLNEPKIISKELIPRNDFIQNDKIFASILEIGKHEKINGEYNLWYKVKINNTVGWVFGGLCSLCARENPTNQSISSPKENSDNQNSETNSNSEKLLKFSEIRGLLINNPNKSDIEKYCGKADDVYNVGDGENHLYYNKVELNGQTGTLLVFYSWTKHYIEIIEFHEPGSRIYLNRVRYMIAPK